MSHKCQRIYEGIEQCESCGASDICDQYRDAIFEMAVKKSLLIESKLESSFDAMFPKSRAIELEFSKYSQNIFYRLARLFRLIPDINDLCGKTIKIVAETVEGESNEGIPNAIYLKCDSSLGKKSVVIPMIKDLTGKANIPHTDSLVEAIKRMRSTDGHPSL